jgi:hypothetical protein
MISNPHFLLGRRNYMIVLPGLLFSLMIFFDDRQIQRSRAKIFFNDLLKNTMISHPDFLSTHSLFY